MGNLKRLQGVAPPPKAPEPEAKPYRPNVLDRLGLGKAIAEDGLLINEPESYLGRCAVEWSRDLQRVVDLPRRVLNLKDPSAAEKWSHQLRRPRELICDCKERFGFCIRSLLPAQGWGLEEAHLNAGLLGLIGVGIGKTGMDLLLPMVVPDCKVAVLFVPPNVKPQIIHRDIPQWAAHFKLPNIVDYGTFHVEGRPALHIISYSELSTAKGTALLGGSLQPDLIIADEAHNLRRRESARTKRFLRYMHEHRGTRLCALSGTLTSRSLKDYAHHAELSLDEGSPLPLHYPTVEEWSTAIDPLPITAPMGALRKLCKTGETVRQGFRRRLVETPGVVATEEGSLGTSLELIERKPGPLPDIVQRGLYMVESWERPDSLAGAPFNEELVEAIDKARCSREVSTGFFYRWKFPRGEPPEVIEKWRGARKAWNRELRQKLHHASEHMDSKALLENAARRYLFGYKGELPVWESDCFAEWEAVKDTVYYETQGVWLSDYLVQDAVAWAKKNTGIIWYDHDEFGRAVARAGGFPFYGGGDEASAEIIKEKGKRTIVASINAHGTGKNFQHAFHKMLVTNIAPAWSKCDWEQLIGRIHRQGQPEDVVEVHLYRHVDSFDDAINTATMRARYVFESTKNQQKLLIASRNWR